VVDLEALALHRGSLFGALEGQPQPAQKWFESCLLRQLDGLDRSRPVLVEAESSKVGNRTLPPALWQAMLAAPRIELTAPLSARTDYLVRTYPEIIADRPLLEAALSRLSVYPGRKRLKAWRLLADAGQFNELVREVVERHYDPSYERSSRRDQRKTLARIELQSLAEADQDAAARTVAEIVSGVGRHEA
jgi:tRNA 2-selenouridine synthase